MLLQWIKRNPALYGFLRYEVYAPIRSALRSRVFGGIYEKNAWDGDFSVSGPGSSLHTTEHVRAALPSVVRELGAASFLDIPCGDFRWMQQVDLGAPYTGGDIVRPLVEQNQRAFPDRTFLHLDLIKGPLPQADIVFCRDCLVHLTFREGRRALETIRASGAKYLIATTFPDLTKNEDTVPPYWRPLNMELAPFDLPPAVKLIRDYADDRPNDRGKHMGVWKL